MGRLFRVILYILVLGAAGLSGYAYLGDLTPDSTETRIPVDLNAE